MNPRRRWMVAVLSGLLGAGLFAQPAGEDPIALLEIKDGVLGWKGLRLGQSQVQVERRVGVTLALRPRRAGEETEVCTPFVAEADFAGERLVLGFPDARPGAKLASLWVRFRGLQADAAQLARALRARAPQATYLPRGETSETDDPMPTYGLPGAPPAAIRFVPESGMLLARQDCLRPSD